MLIKKINSFSYFEFEPDHKKITTMRDLSISC